MSGDLVVGKVVAFVGLGQIGGPLAAHLLADGARVRAYRRTRDKLLAWGRDNPAATLCTSPADACQGAEVLITCVGDDADLQDVFQGKHGALQALKKGSLAIDHTTASPKLARDLSEVLAERQVGYVDAPVSGGSSGAQNRTLSIMIGGDDESVQRALPFLNAYGKSIYHIGSVGSGQLCKLANQVCIAGVLEGLAEGIALAKTAGMDVQKVLQALSGGAAASWQMQNRASFMVENRYVAGFTAELMHKDLGLALSALRDLGVDAPVTGVVLSRYADLLAKGLGREDFSNLYRLTKGR